MGLPFFQIGSILRAWRVDPILLLPIDLNGTTPQKKYKITCFFI